MNDQLDQEIRSALQRRAASLPPDAADALTRIDYTAAPGAERVSRRGGTPARLWALWLPGGKPLRTPWHRPAFGAAAATLAAGIAVAVVLLTSTAPDAYAGWSPVPTTPTPEALAAASAACKSLHPGPLAARAGGRSVLTDARGRYTALISVGGGDVSDCISDGHRDHTSIGGDSLTLRLYKTPGPDQLGTPSGGGGSAPGFGGGRSVGAKAYQRGEKHLLGLAGSDITGVTLVFANGATVEATVQNGWYFAWWPYARELPQDPRPASAPLSWPISVRMTTRSGKTVTSPMPSKRCDADRTCVFAGLNPR